MNVLEGIDALKNGLMWVGLSALAAIAVGVIGAWLCRGVASATRRLLTVARIIAFAVVSAFCVLRGGAKFLMPPPSTGGTPVVPVVVTQEEIAQGWRLESVTTNEAVSYAMPTNGVEYMPWSLGGGDSQTNSVTFRCIEPLRKLVTTEQVGGRYVNPSRLVMGTNAVLKVGANGPFSPSEVNWRVVSGPGRAFPTNGWETTVTPTGIGTVTIEARFNDDEIQPRFVLPVVQPRRIPVRVFIVEPPREQKSAAWSDGEVIQHIDKANEIFSQIGVRFQLDGILHNVGTSNDWDLCVYEDRNYGTKWGEILIEDHTEQFERLVNVYTNRDCIKIFYVGTLRQSSKIQYDGIFAEWKAEGILMPKGMLEESLAHELGHALRLSDIYLNNWCGTLEQPTRRVDLAEQGFPLEKRFFGDLEHDWGQETGRGFYELNDTLGATLKKFLMFGVYLDLNNVGCDIPSDTVHGIPAGATTQGDARLITIGARETERHANEVYSR